MSEWQKGNLGEFINLKRGYDLPSKSRVFGEFPIISSSGITDYHNKPKVFEGGVITGRYGTIGQVFYTDKPFHPLNTTLYVQDFKDNNKKFVYYFLKELDWEKFSDKSAVPGINRNDVHQEIVSFPPLPEQQAIASMLSSLDVKIDLLNRQNKTLEAMAETLFRQWFIEEAKDDWEELALKELVKVIDNRGKTPPYQDFKTEHPIIEVNALTNDGRLVNYSVIRKFVDDSIFQTWFRQHLEDLDILFSTVGSIGSIGMFFKNGACVAQNVIGIRAMNKISNFYLYQWLLYNQEEIRELDIGSVQPSIKVPHLLALQIRIPDKNILDKFDLVIKGFIDKLKSNQEQIQTLENLRDTLLPKLMSGEIRVQH